MKASTIEKQRERCRTNRKKNNNYNDYKRAHRTGLRGRVDAIKESQPCMDCGLFWPACVMEYDHRPGEKKRSTVSRMVAAQYAWEKIEEEIAKCDCVCANCHRIRTHITRKAP